MHAAAFIAAIRTNWHTINGLLAWRTLIPSFIHFPCVCLYECICYAFFKNNFQKIFQNDTGSRPSVFWLFCFLPAFFFYLPLYFSPLLAATIYSLSCQPLPILQPPTLTLTLPCLCHWDKSERYHILSFPPLCCRVEFCLSHQSSSCRSTPCYFFQIPTRFAFQLISAQTGKHCSWLKEMVSLGI